MADPVTFDGPGNQINVDFGVTEIDVRRDLYSAWKRWVITGEGAKYMPLMRTVAGDDLGGGKKLGSAYFMLEGCKIKPHEASHTLNVTGSLFVENAATYGDDPFIPTTGAYTVSIRSATSEVLLADVEETNLIPHLGAIYYDENANNTGTVVGTDGVPGNPVSSEAAIHGLHDQSGLNLVRIMGTLTLSEDHAEPWMYEGLNPSSMLNMDGYSVDGGRISRMGVTGQQGGSGQVQWDMVVCSGVTNAFVFGDKVWLKGDLEVRAGSHVLTNVFDSVPGDDEPVLSFGSSSATEVNIQNYRGELEIANMGANHKIEFAGSDAEIIILASCTGGTIEVYGSVLVVDQSGGAVTVIDERQTADATTTADAVWAHATATSFLSKIGSLWNKLWPKKRTFVKDSDTQYTETIYEQDGVTPEASFTHTKSGDDESVDRV